MIKAKWKVLIKPLGKIRMGRMRCMEKGPTTTSLRNAAIIHVANQVESVRVEFEHWIETIEQDREREREEFKREKEESLARKVVRGKK